MSAFYFSRLILQAFPKQPVTHRSTVFCIRRITALQQSAKEDDAPIQMENPYKEPAEKCILCNETIDFRNVQLLSQFISPTTGRIYSRRLTGLCRKKQKEVSKAIKRARALGIMSVVMKDPLFMQDPDICGSKFD